MYRIKKIKLCRQVALALLIGVAFFLQNCSDTDETDNSVTDKMEIARAVLNVKAADLPEVLEYFTNDVEYHDAIIDFNGIENMTIFLNNLFILFIHFSKLPYF